MIAKKPRKYIPIGLEIKWENLEPLYKELLARPINSVEELEHWLHDRSELEAALEELPEEQREVFVAHEIEGQSFKEIAAATGVGVNTLLSRKHYAVIQLRERLQTIYDEFGKT